MLGVAPPLRAIHPSKEETPRPSGPRPSSGDPYKRCSETGRGTQPQIFLGEGAHSQVRTTTSNTTTSAAMWKDSSNGKRRYFVIIYESQAVERST